MADWATGQDHSEGSLVYGGAVEVSLCHSGHGL